MNYRVIHPKELDGELSNRWRELQRSHSDLAGPYFCPEFTRTVGQVRDDARVVLIEDANRVQGFFPLQVRGIVGQPIGGALSDFHGIISDPDTDIDVKSLMQAAGTTIFNFDHLLAWQKPFAPHISADEVSPFMDLSGGYEDYAERVRAGGSKQILKSGTLRRKLEREHGELRYVSRTTDPAVIEAVLRWKMNTYEQSREMFTRDWTIRLIDEILKADSPEFAGLCSALYVGDTLVAGHIGMRSETVWHYWFPSYDDSWSKFSPGVILLLMMAESAPEMGIGRIDLGKGMSMYKERLMSGVTDIVEGAVELPSVATAWRRCLRGIKNVLRHSPLAPVIRAPGRFVRRIVTGSRYE